MSAAGSAAGSEARGHGLLRRASPIVAGRGAASLLTFLIPVVLARHLTAHAYGTYKQVFLIATTFFLVGQLGLTGSLLFFLPRAGAARGRWAVQTLALLLGAGAAAAAAIGVGGAELARRFDNPDLARLIVPLGLYVWAAIGAAPLEVILTATGRTGWAGLCYALSDAARTAALLAPIVGGRGLDAMVWAACAFAALRLLAAWILVLAGGAGPAAWPTRSALREQLGWSLPFAGAVALGVAVTQVTPFLVAALTDAATFAVFAVGALQIPFTDLIYTPVAEVMMVRLTAARPKEAVALFREAVSRLALFFLPLLAFAWAASPELIPTLYTPRYAAAVPIFALAAAELLLSCCPVDGLLRALGATRTLLRVNVARLAIALASVPAGLVLFGLPGAVTGQLLAGGVAKVLLVRAAARRLGEPARALVPGRTIAAWAARSTAVWAAVTAVRLAGPWRGWSFLAAGAATAAGVWVLALATAGELRGDPPVGRRAEARVR